MMRTFWSPDEMALLEKHIDDRNWFPKVRPHMTGRSEAALRKQMCNLRAEQGQSDRRSPDWVRDARKSTKTLLAALNAAGLRAA